MVLKKKKDQNLSASAATMEHWNETRVSLAFFAASSWIMELPSILVGGCWFLQDPKTPVPSLKLRFSSLKIMVSKFGISSSRGALFSGAKMLVSGRVKPGTFGMPPPKTAKKFCGLTKGWIQHHLLSINDEGIIFWGGRPHFLGKLALGPIIVFLTGVISLQPVFFDERVRCLEIRNQNLSI